MKGLHVRIATPTPFFDPDLKIIFPVRGRPRVAVTVGVATNVDAAEVVASHRQASRRVDEVEGHAVLLSRGQELPRRLSAGRVKSVFVGHQDGDDRLASIAGANVQVEGRRPGAC